MVREGRTGAEKEAAAGFEARASAIVEQEGVVASAAKMAREGRASAEKAAATRLLHNLASGCEVRALVQRVV